MRRGTRTEVCRNAYAGPGRQAQKIRQQRLSAGTQSQKRMRWTARLSKSALDNLLQRGFAEHEPARRERLAERKRPATDRDSVRFSPALAHGSALCDRARDRHIAHQSAGTNRKTVELLPSKRPAPQ